MTLRISAQWTVSSGSGPRLMTVRMAKLLRASTIVGDGQDVLEQQPLVARRGPAPGLDQEVGRSGDDVAGAHHGRDRLERGLEARSQLSWEWLLHAQLQEDREAEPGLGTRSTSAR